MNDFFKKLKVSIENKNLVSEKLVLEKYAFQVSIIDYDKPLVFTFDNMDASNTETIAERSGWGHSFLLKLGFNVCSFLESDIYRWYRDKEFHQLINEIKVQNLFNNFPALITYGSSMGGYAASAYANVLNVDLAILINPISTLNRNKAPFETRFSRPKLADWEGLHHDGVEGIRGVKSYIVYDPLFSLDALHAKRYLNKNKNIQEIKVFGFGHGLPWHLKSLNVLKPLIISLLNDEFDGYRELFYSDIRKRRLSYRYYQFMLSEENVYLTINRAKIIHKTMVLEFSKRYKKDADFFREMHNIYVELDDELAFAFISRAVKIRPNGNVINSKYKKLEEKMKNKNNKIN